MSTQALTIRIGADANGAISVISQTTSAVNNLGNAGTRANSGVASLTGGVQNLGRWSGQTTSATASLTGGVNGLSRATLDAVNGTSRLNQSLAENTRVTNAAAGSMRSLTSVLGAFGITVGAVGLVEFTKNIVRNGMEIESLRAQLNMTLPSLAAAKESFNLIVKIAKETPQSISEISKAYIMMNNMGLNPTERAMRGLTDMAAKLGGASDTLTGVIRGLGQAWMKGALHAQDTNQMIERGVPVYALLVKVTGKTTAELIKMMEAGELTRGVMEKLHEELFKWGGGSSAIAMETTRGKIEALGSAWSAFSDVVMNSGVGKLLKAEVDGMTTALEYFTKKLNTTVDEQIAQKQVRLVELKKGFDDDKFTYLKPNTTASRIEEYKQTEIFLAQLLRQKQKGIDDAAQYQKDKDTQASGEKLATELATRKAIENGDTDALKKYMSEKLSAIKETDKEIIRQQAELASIPAKLAMAIVSVESTGQMVVNKNSGAAGLMQVMPANYQKQGYTQAQMLSDASISVKAGLKVWQDSMDVAKKAVVQGTIDAGQIFDYAATLYTTKHQTIIDRIKKNGGVFDINLFKEAGDWANKVKAGMGLQNVSENDIFAPYKKSANEAAQATKKFTTEQEQAAKKIADNDRQLTESTAFGKYNATIDELTESFKRGGISQATYSQGIENANETLLKNTDYVQENIKLLDEQAKQYAKNVGHVNDYNATIDELRANLARGGITKGEYGLGVAQANAGLMNQVEYPNANISNISVNQVAEVIDAKNINDSAKELAKFTEESNKAITALDSFGNSGKMAFDGILGGISAVASAATSFSDEMNKLNNGQAERAASYEKFMKDSTKSESDKAAATRQFAKEKEAYDAKSFATEISGARSLAGATAKLFSEKSAARKAFHAIEMGLAVVEIAMSAKKMIVDVAAGAANMFAQGGFAGFAGVAAMAAVMGGLGFAMSSGSKPAQDDTMKASVTTGTVLGDASASSNSIKNIIQTLNDIHAKEYPELKATADAFRTLGGSVDGFIKTLAQGTQSFTNFKGIGIPNAPVIGSNNSLRNGLLTSVGTSALSGVAATGVLGAGAATFAAGGLSSALSAVGLTGLGATVGGGLGGAAGAGAMAAGTGLAAGLATAGIGLVIAGAIYGLGKLLGIGKTKITQLGEGFVINSVNMFQDGMEGALNPQTFAKWEAKTKGWFSDTKKIIESFGNLSDDMKGAILDIYIATKGAILASSTSLGLNDLLGQKILDYATPNLKIDWFKIKTEKGDVGKYISDTLNTMTDNIATDIFGNLLGSFQDMGEGMLETIARLGSQYAIVSSTLGKYGEKLHATDMGMISLSDSLVRMYSATGDAKEGLKNFIDVMNSFYDAVVPQGVKSQKAFSNMSGFAKKIGIDEKDLGSPDVLKAAIFDNFEKKKKLSDEAAIAEAELTKQREAVNNFYNPKTSTDLNTQLDPVWAKYSKTTDWANFQFSDLTNGFTEELVRSRALEHAGTSAGMLYNEIIRVAETNAKNKAAGLASGGNKWLSVADLEASIAPLTEKLKTANENLAEVTALTPDLKEWEKAVTDLADNYQEKFLNLGRTDAEKIAVERAKILKNVDGLDFDFAITKGFEPIIKAMRAAGIEGEINAKKIMEFTWAQEDAAKSVKKLADATKYFDGFTQNIKSWIQNLKTTQLGSPESQFNAAKDNFAAQMKIINGGLATSAEEKQAALSGITGVADTYIAAIKNNYASTKEGQDLINQVAEQISGLTTSVDVQQLQLGVLQQIRDGVHDIPTGISDTQKEFFTGLATKIDSAQKTYISAPTSQNDLIANTLAKEWTMAVDYATKGSGFLDAFIKSFDGKTGLDAAVNLIFSDKSLNPVQAQTTIDNVLSRVISLVNIEVVPRFLTTVAQREIDQQIALLNPSPIYLNIDTTSAASVIKNVTDTATDVIRAINNLDALGSLTAINPSIYNAPEMLQTVTPQLMQSSPFAAEPKIGGGIPADSSILKRLSSIDTARSSNAGNSSSDAKETVEELKKQTAELTELVKQTTALLRLQIAANQELVEKMNSMDESLKTTAKKTRLSAVGGAK